MNKRVILLYGDQNLNVVDGSAIWLVSVAETLAQTADVVHLQLKARAETERLVGRLRSIPNIVIHDPVLVEPQEALRPNDAREQLELLHAKLKPTIVVVRGREASLAVCQSPILAPDLWSYVTDFEAPATTPRHVRQLRTIAGRSFRMFTQTEATRSYLETLVPEAVGKCVLMSPMIPDHLFKDLAPEQPDSVLRLVYSGKMHEAWQTLEMLRLPKLLQDAGVEARLTVIGDKIQRSRENPGWADAMDKALTSPPEGVEWLGAMSRDDALSRVADQDVGIGWRSDELNQSLEISSKLLEYAAVGTPPLVNRSSLHEELLGVDYPLFIERDDIHEVVRVLKLMAGATDRLRAPAQAAVRGYSASASAERFRQAFDRAQFEAQAEPKQSILVAPKHAKARDLIEIAQRHPALNLYEVQPGCMPDDTAGDVVVVMDGLEVKPWWLAVRKPAGTIARVHPETLTVGQLMRLGESGIGALVVTSEIAKKQIGRLSGWPEGKIHVIPRAIDVVDLRRPKTASAAYTLALGNATSPLANPQVALRLLERLRSEDERFRLLVPADAQAVLAAHADFLAVIGSDDADGVALRPAMTAPATMMRDLGWWLETSHRDDTFGAALAAGSGAVPLLLEGQSPDFPTELTMPSIEAAAEAILHEADLRSYAAEFARRQDLAQVAESWRAVLAASLEA